jgi:hypothetical protein
MVTGGDELTIAAVATLHDRHSLICHECPASEWKTTGRFSRGRIAARLTALRN